jgi:hypothetical protein
MNERLKDLEIQCWEPRQYGPPWFNAEKFAQLIIQECIEIVEPCKCGCRCEQEVTITDSIIADIKEHFGVTE